LYTFQGKKKKGTSIFLLRGLQAEDAVLWMEESQLVKLVYCRQDGRKP
jgi:hypothetical protein